MDGDIRPEGRVPISTNLREPPSVSEVRVEGATLRVHMSPLRAVQRSQGLHQVAETCGISPEAEGNALFDLPGRHIADVTSKGRPRSPGEGSPVHSPEPRFSHKLEEVTPTAIAKSGSSWSLCQ